MTGPIRRAGLLACSALALCSGGAAHAQVVERNPPPAVQPGESGVVLPDPTPPDQDATPIGPPLRALVLLGAEDSVRAAAPEGLDIAAAPRLGPGTLREFLGQPISRRLIAEIEAEIARQYRRAGYPFVSVSTPEQEITDGVLQIRVIEFAAGDIAVTGADPETAGYLRSRIRLASGAPISSAALLEDMEWLNRYPFRRTQAIFRPGPALGQSDLTLDVTQLRPWTVYGGFANSGTRTTGTARYFVGAQAGGLIGRDSVVGYQATGSSDVLSDGGVLFGGLPHPRYISHALQVTVPGAPRTAFSGALGWIETNQDLSPFAVRQRTLEGVFGYETALSNFAPRLTGAGSARLGVEARRQTEILYFAGAEAQRANIEIYQLYLGYRRVAEGARTRSLLDVALHASPGGIGDANSAQRAALQSRGRLSDMQYAYLSAALGYAAASAQGWSWSLNIAGQYATEPLPATEQSALGGVSAVRGYQLDDAAVDRMIVVRNELHPPSWRLPSAVIDPFVFLDIGTGRDIFARADVTAASAGLGANVVALDYLTMNLTLAGAMSDAAVTRAGDWRLETRIAFSY